MEAAEQAEIRLLAKKSMWVTKRWRKWRDAPLAEWSSTRCDAVLVPVWRTRRWSKRASNASVAVSGRPAATASAHAAEKARPAWFRVAHAPTATPIVLDYMMVEYARRPRSTSAAIGGLMAGR
jgi:hypothetical protein